MPPSFSWLVRWLAWRMDWRRRAIIDTVCWIECRSREMERPGQALPCHATQIATAGEWMPAPREAAS